MPTGLAAAFRLSAEKEKRCIAYRTINVSGWLRRGLVVSIPPSVSWPFFLPEADPFRVNDALLDDLTAFRAH